MSSVSERVLIVTDDDFLADAVGQVLRSAGLGVHCAAWGPVEPMLLEHRPALVVLDAGEQNMAERPMPVARLRQASDIGLVVITRSTRLEDRLGAFEAGADDVIVMPFPLAELRWKITTIMRRSGHPIDRLALGDFWVDVGAHLVERNGAPIDLTALEFSLLVAMGRHKGTVLSKTQLLNLVWGYEHFDVNLVEVHMSALRRKLESAGPRVLHTVRGVGYVLRPVPAAFDPESTGGDADRVPQGASLASPRHV